MRIITYREICAWDPRGSPERFVPNDWSGTVLNLLRDRRIPIEYRFSIACEEDIVDAKVKRKFAILCAKRVEHLLTDDRLRHAILVSEKYVDGQATEEEIEAACVEAKKARKALGELQGNPEHDAVVNAASAACYAAIGNMEALYATARAVTAEAAVEALWDDEEDRYRLEWCEALEAVRNGVFHLYIAKLANLIQGK